MDNRKKATIGVTAGALALLIVMLLLLLDQKGLLRKSEDPPMRTEISNAAFLSEGAECAFTTDSFLYFFLEGIQRQESEEEGMENVIFHLAVAVEDAIREPTLPVENFYAVFGSNNGYKPDSLFLNDCKQETADLAVIPIGENRLSLHFRVPRETAEENFAGAEVFLYVTVDGKWNPQAPIIKKG